MLIGKEHGNGHGVGKTDVRAAYAHLNKQELTQNLHSISKPKCYRFRQLRSFSFFTSMYFPASSGSRSHKTPQTGAISLPHN